MLTEPISVMVRRYRCPFCSRSRAAKTATAEHIGRCWKNPAVRSCRTCRNFEPADCCGMPDTYQCYTPMCPDGPTCKKGVEIGTGVVTGCELWEVLDAPA